MAAINLEVAKPRQTPFLRWLYSTELNTEDWAAAAMLSPAITAYNKASGCSEP